MTWASLELGRLRCGARAFGLAQFGGLFAIRAKSPNEPLRHDRADRGGDQKWLHPDVDQARDGRGRIVGVQRAEDEVAGQAGVGRDRRRLQIANLADHDDVRRLPQNGAKRGGKSHPDIGVHLHLVDAGHLVFDRVFDGDDFPVRPVDEIQTGIKRARLAGTGRASHEEDAVGQAEQSLERLLVVAEKSKLGQTEHRSICRGGA